MTPPKAARTASYIQTIIHVQGDPQDAFEVYADESREQTLGFVFDERFTGFVEACNMHDGLMAANIALTAENNRYRDDIAAEADERVAMETQRDALAEALRLVAQAIEADPEAPTVEISRTAILHVRSALAALDGGK